MDIDDEDEFGDLYTDVLRPLSSAAPFSSPAAAPLPTPPPLAVGGGVLAKKPSSDKPVEAFAPLTGEDPKDDWLPDDWNDDGDDGGAQVANLKAKAEPGGFAGEGEARGSGSGVGAAKIGEGEGFRVSGAVKVEIADLDQEPVIPGLSAAPSASNGGGRVSNADDWDSDSEDDLQIVLNDNSHLPMGGAGNEDDDDEDGEDFVIVTDGDQQLHHHPSMEEADWGEGDAQPAADGERKDGSDAAKANGAAQSIPGGPRIGYSSHGFHPQHHSMFKYIRPGAAAPGAHIPGIQGQLRPPSAMGAITGRGRGEWRPAGGRGIPGGPKSFHSGFGPGWGNNSSRPFGGGLDFTLPSHKTIFDVDIESFEEKPWRHPGVDITDYFNFGLDDDKWKEYCKQLDQLRLESTMQSKIRVYESGRSEQDYDPDLPPELAAAAGHHEIAVDNMNHGKMDNGQSDLSCQGRGLPFTRVPFPPGRAIQVETGCGERLPSIDTRPVRNRDTDAIIEIVLQDSFESALEQPGKGVLGEEIKGGHETDADRRSDSEYYDRLTQTSNGQRRDMGTRRTHNAHGEEGTLPSESPLYNSNSRLDSPAKPAGSFGTHRGGRSTRGASRGRYTSPSGDQSTRNVLDKKPDNEQVEISDKSAKHGQTSDESHPIDAETAGEVSVEQKDDENEDMLVLGDDMLEVEEEEETSDFRLSGENLVDDDIDSSRKQKLSSRVEQTTQGNIGAGDDDLRSTHSDNSPAKSGSSNQKRRESGDEEVEGGRSKRVVDVRRRHEEEAQTLWRKDDYGREGRHEMDPKRVGPRGREAIYHSYPHRDWDGCPIHPVQGRSEGFERPRETDTSFRQRRDEDAHGRRRKEEDIRRERNEEVGLRHRSKIRISERNEKDDGSHLKKRLDDGDWRDRNREGAPRLRERDDVLGRRDNTGDHQIKRKKDEEQSRRERTDKEDSLNSYRVKEDSSRRKRDRDDNPDHRRRDDSSRIRDKTEDHHSSKHKDESRRQMERENRRRLKPPHEDPLPSREREEGRASTRSARAEDKALGGSTRNKSDPKILASDKEIPHTDKRRHGEQSRRDRAGEEFDSQRKGREDVLTREKHYGNEERSSRHERLSSHSERPGAADNSQRSHERHREVTTKNKDVKGSAPGILGKRKHEDRGAQLNEKVGSKGPNDEENNHRPYSSEKQGEGDLVSDDEGQNDSKRGRSKLERWASLKERDHSIPDNTHSSPKAKDLDMTTDDTILTDELPRTEGNVCDSDPRSSDGGQQAADKSGDDKDRHLDTVEKLKRRTERFKLPMPGEKDMAKRSEYDAQQPTQSDVQANSEVKPERPARKRRWTST